MMPGMIMLWYGSVATIPSGWSLCDGTLNTPDLRSRFVIGAHDGLPPNGVGGTTGHIHAFTGDGHAHDLPAGTDLHDAGGLGDWSHHTSTTPATGDTDGAGHMPPYWALCYIMKQPIP